MKPPQRFPSPTEEIKGGTEFDYRLFCQYGGKALETTVSKPKSGDYYWASADVFTEWHISRVTLVRQEITFIPVSCCALRTRRNLHILSELTFSSGLPLFPPTQPNILELSFHICVAMYHYNWPVPSRRVILSRDDLLNREWPIRVISILINPVGNICFVAFNLLRDGRVYWAYQFDV